MNKLAKTKLLVVQTANWPIAPWFQSHVCAENDLQRANDQKLYEGEKCAQGVHRRGGNALLEKIADTDVRDTVKFVYHSA
jgi:hypothetical protein